MKNQLISIPRVVYRPKSTLINLPNNKLYILAFLAPLYFGYARSLRTGAFSRLTEMTGNKLFAFAILVLIGVIVIPIGALLVKLIIRIFGKRLTLFKLMNLYGYALVPRLLVSVPFSIYMNFLISEDTKIEIMLLDEIPLWFNVVTIIGAIALFYCMVLYIYGIVVSPSIISDSSQSDVSLEDRIQ